jgi:hypothetical protein
MEPVSEFVEELLHNWIEQIEDTAKLDVIQNAIDLRRFKLEQESLVVIRERLLDEYDCIRKAKGTPDMFTVKELPIDREHWQNRGKPFDTYKCRFWQWQPRKKILWVAVDWYTGRSHYGENFLALNTEYIDLYQPSRYDRRVKR